MPRTLKARVREALHANQIVRQTSYDLKTRFNQDVDYRFFNQVYDLLLEAGPIISAHDKLVAERDSLQLRLDVLATTSRLARLLGGKG